MATELDKVNNGALATLIAVVALGVVGIALAVTALTRQQVSVHNLEKEGSAQAERLQLLKSQTAALEQGVPIQEAMKTLVRELANNPRSASPAPSAQPASAASGGAGGSGGASGVSDAGGTAGTGGEMLRAVPSAPGVGAAGSGGKPATTSSSAGKAAVSGTAPKPSAAGGASPQTPQPATPKPPPSAAPNHGP